ncbi:hypothetical protein AZE42_14117 [Rhizopogon vesiculosus]|uniref:Uncharacterized protein n=1 Tax=Rhizopogon vesiculosus TaxID=180088 RepID=A0A1J8QV98_9AGAM|nr:hypothetical protein AZE42_14117 [Rhizopogon vesiculosus]
MILATSLHCMAIVSRAIWASWVVL